jgi:hypothetical protein
MGIKNNIPEGSKRIKFKRNDYLYIETNIDHTEKIKNTLGEFDQEYVYIRDGIDGYEISLTSFVEEKRKVKGKTCEKKRN